MAQPLDIREWCTSEFEYDRSFPLPPAILSTLLDEDINSVEEFIAKAKEKIDPTPKNMYVPFNPPVFPFDNKDFEDPFYLVENCAGDIIDLKYLKGLSDDELDGYFKDVYARFSYKSGGRIKIKKKELLHYAGKSYYFETTRAARGIKPQLNKRRDKSFLMERKNSESKANIHIPETTRRGIIRRKVHLDGTLVRDEDIVCLKRRSTQRADIVVAIDSSTSMEQGGKLEFARKACLSFHYYQDSRLRDARLEFISFNERVEKIAPLDVLTLKPGGMTHTAELLDFVFRYFSSQARENPELYIITDGYPQRSGIDDAGYLSITLKTASKLRPLRIKTKILLIQPPDYEANSNTVAYNRLICEGLGGQLAIVGPEALSCAMIDIMAVRN